MRTHVQKFDEQVTRSLQSLPSTWEPFFRQMTLIGQPVFALVTAMGIAYYGEYTQTWQLMIAGVVAIIATLLGAAFKIVLRRHRPDTLYAKSMFIKTYSFPSGHAVATITCYGLAAYLFIASGNALLMILGAVLLPMIVAIGASRVYLGAHYPSDIIGGWTLGGLGLGVAIWILHL